MACVCVGNNKELDAIIDKDITYIHLQQTKKQAATSHIVHRVEHVPISCGKRRVYRLGVSG